MAPDPFDARGVYQAYTSSGNTNNLEPTFAVYPLIALAGPDKAFT